MSTKKKAKALAPAAWKPNPRLPESMRRPLERAAKRAGMSVNERIVKYVRAGLRGGK